jgi:hypothetical protein
MPFLHKDFFPHRLLPQPTSCLSHSASWFSIHHAKVLSALNNAFYHLAPFWSQFTFVSLIRPSRVKLEAFIDDSRKEQIEK